MIHRLDVRLSIAFAGVALVALALAGAAFVLLQKDAVQQQAVDRLNVRASQAQVQYIGWLARQGEAPDYQGFVEETADAFDLRAIVVSPEQLVVADSAGELVGRPLGTGVEQPTMGATFRVGGPAVQLTGTGGEPNYVVTTAGAPLPGTSFQPATVVRFPSDRLVLATPKTTLTNAWLGLLPSLAMAGAVAVPIALVLAVLLARQVTRPVAALTGAANRMREGDFAVALPSGRKDEVGRLAGAFDEMARRVGEMQLEMRALVSGVSHDLKTPLTSILGFAHALERHPDAPEETRRAGAVIREEGERLSRRLSELLYLSELESGHVVLEREVLDLGRLAGAVAARLGGEEPGWWRLELGEPVLVDGDGARLERAVENLLDNAKKYGLRDEPITVRVSAVDGRGVLTIQNGAPWLAEADLAGLFGRYRRISPPGEEVADGTGLGLAIAADIARLHGGAITAEMHGADVRFALALPLAKEAPAAPPAAVLAAAG